MSGAPIVYKVSSSPRITTESDSASTNVRVRHVL